MKLGLGWRKKMRGALDAIGRTARVGNYWYWVEPADLSDGVAIAEIVCPLRYDVLVRRDFFNLYAEYRELHASDAGAFSDLAKESPYYRWFMQSEAVRTKRALLGDAQALEAEFRARVRRATELYESVLRDGFAPQHPIILKTAERLLPPTGDRLAPPTGKAVARKYFLADGCHRLALLMSMGWPRLPAGYFRVKCFRAFSPFDSTYLLAHTLPIPPEAYFSFLSSYYCAPYSFTTREALLKHVRETRPALLEEVCSVIHADGFA